jgi:ABC-2 type transport system permease protein
MNPTDSPSANAFGVAGRGPGSPPVVDASERSQAPSAARTLRRLFLTLFLRGRSARGLSKESAPKSLGQKLALSLLIYLLIGLAALPFRGKPVFALSVWLHSMTFVFLGMFVAASAGEILFNKEEADILLHRPIQPRALLWAKIATLVQVSLWMAGALNIAGLWIGVTATDGGWRFAAIHVTSTVLEALFCTGFVVVSYQLCLRWLGRERLEGLMTTAQVVVAIAAVMAGQLLPQVVWSRGLTMFSAESWWIGLLPPAWFAALDDAVSGTMGSASWALAAPALLGTAIVLWLAFGRLAGDYGSGLQSLSEAISPAKRRRDIGRWIAAIVDRPPLRWWLRDPVERASFLLVAAYLLRDRDVKLRVFPGLAPMLVMPIVFLMKQPSGSGPAASNFNFSGFTIGFVGGFLGLIPLMGLSLLQYSQQWRAADIFRTAPLSSPAPLCQGARRAILCFLTLPVGVAFLLLIWFGSRGAAPLVLLLPGIIALPVYSMVPTLGGGCVPLSNPAEDAKSVGRGLNMIVVMFIAMAISGIAAVSWAAGWFWWFVLGETILAAGFYYALRRRLAVARWPSLE